MKRRRKRDLEQACSLTVHQLTSRKMVGTIRRPVQDTPDSSNSGAPPPPSYQAAISPSAARVPPASSSSSSGNINAGAFQQQRQPSGGNPSYSRHSVAVTGSDSDYGRQLPQAPGPQRPQSYAQPSGAPPQQQQQQSQFRQPQGPPPQRAYSNASSHSNAAPGPSSGAALQRSNTQEDRLAVCRWHEREHSTAQPCLTICPTLHFPDNDV